MDTERRAFNEISANENLLCKKEGNVIFRQLKAKYPDLSNEHMDIIMNSLSSAMIHHIYHHVAPDNYPMIVQVIYKTLTDNLKSLAKLEKENKNDK